MPLNICHISCLSHEQVQKPPMFAFVEYEDERDAEDAVREKNMFTFPPKCYSLII